MPKFLNQAAIAAFCLTAASAAIAPAAVTTLMNDGFDRSDVTTPTSGSLEGTFIPQAVVNNTLVGSTSRLSFGFTQSQTASTFNGYANGSGNQSLGVGDSINLSFKYQYKSAANAADAMRISLGNSNNTRVQTAGTNAVGSAVNDDVGYGVRFNPFQGAMTGGSFIAFAGTATTTALGSTFAETTPSATTNYDFSFTITRKDVTTLTLSASITGSPNNIFSTQALDVAGATNFFYDEIFVRMVNNTSTGNNVGPVLFDSMVLTLTTVPEPASLAVLGLAGLAIVRRRR